MSGGEIAIAVVCAVLVVFSLIVAMVVPRRRPDFPRGRLSLFFVAALALVAAMLATIEVAGGEDGEAAAQTTATQPQETQPAATPPAESAPAETAPASDPVAGKKVFLAAGCTQCHTLADAGATGTVGPSLDQTKPDLARVIDRVTNGKSPMPSFAGTLSEQEIADVAAYVVQATAGP